MILAQAQRRGQVAGRGAGRSRGGSRDHRVGHRRDHPVSDVRDRSHRPYCLSVGRSVRVCRSVCRSFRATEKRPPPARHSARRTASPQSPLGIGLEGGGEGAGPECEGERGGVESAPRPGPLRRPIEGVGAGPGFVAREVGAETGDVQREPQQQPGCERGRCGRFQGEAFSVTIGIGAGRSSRGGRREGRPTAAHASIVASPGPAVSVNFLRILTRENDSNTSPTSG